MTKKVNNEEYMAPEIETIQIENEGVLCGSDGNENYGEEPGNGMFS